MVMASLPYVIVYEVGGDTIHILRILHTSQDWPHE